MWQIGGILHFEGRNSYHNRSVVVSSSSVIPLLSQLLILQLWMALLLYTSCWDSFVHSNGSRLYQNYFCLDFLLRDCSTSTWNWGHEQWQLQDSLSVNHAAWCYQAIQMRSLFFLAPTKITSTISKLGALHATVCPEQWSHFIIRPENNTEEKSCARPCVRISSEL